MRNELTIRTRKCVFIETKQFIFEWNLICWNFLAWRETSILKDIADLIEWIVEKALEKFAIDTKLHHSVDERRIHPTKFGYTVALFTNANLCILRLTTLKPHHIFHMCWFVVWSSDVDRFIAGSNASDFMLLSSLIRPPLPLSVALLV